MTSAHPLGPGVRRVVGDGHLVEVGEDDGVTLLRPDGASRDVLVLHQRPPEPVAVLAEADRLSWLDSRAGASEVLAAGRADRGDEAVVIRLGAQAVTAVNGHPLGPERLVEVLAATLRELHSLGVDRCPLDAGFPRLRAEVADRVAAGLVRPSADGPYAGRSVEDLLGLLDEMFDDLGSPTPVMIHGGLRADRVWFDPTGVTLTGWRRGGVGDAHLDLAAAAAMVSALHGPALVAPLMDEYGLDDVDPRRLDASQLLAHLLS